MQRNEKIDSYGSTVYKKDKNKPFTKEQIEFIKQYKNVKLEIEDDRIVILSDSAKKSHDVAIDIVNRFSIELKIMV